MTTTSYMYTAHVEGFTGQFASLGDLREWAHALNARYKLSGRTLTIQKCSVHGDCLKHLDGPSSRITRVMP